MPSTKTLTIESLAPGGDGVTSLDQILCFIPHTVPGDIVRVGITFAGRYASGRLLSIVSPSPHRQPSPCPVFPRCGGCVLLHIVYPEQLRLKFDMIRRLFPDIEFEATVCSPKALGYRRLARLHFRPSPSMALGFFQERGHHVVDIDACPALEAPLSRLLPILKNGPLRHLRQKAEILLSNGENGQIVYIITRETPSAIFFETLRALIPDSLSGALIDMNGIVSHIGGDNRVLSRLHDTDIWMPAGSFGQANRQVNLAMFQLLNEWIRSEGPFQRAIELFSGAGNLSCAIAPHVRRLVCVEKDPVAARLARDNMAFAHVHNTTIHSGDADVLFDAHGHQCDLVVMDPPRVGAGGLIDKLNPRIQKTLVYISCNPRRLQRDAQVLQQNGYACCRAVCLDMFPQTMHMEVAMLFKAVPIPSRPHQAR